VLESSRWLLEHLLQAETTDRAMRAVGHQMHAAKIPVHRDLAGFDFEGSPVDRKLIHTLAELGFTDAAQNVVLVGGPGTVKTHLATAIGVSAITRHGKRVRFYSTVDLVNALEQEKSQGKAGRIALSLLRMDLVILDELGYLLFSQAGGALLFHLLSRLITPSPCPEDRQGRLNTRVRFGSALALQVGQFSVGANIGSLHARKSRMDEEFIVLVLTDDDETVIHRRIHGFMKSEFKASARARFSSLESF